MKTKFYPLIVVVFLLTAFSATAQRRPINKFGIQIGYDMLPAQFFTPTSTAEFNPGLYDSGANVKYLENVAPRIGMVLDHGFGRYGSVVFSMNYQYHMAKYEISESMYHVLYEDVVGEMTFKNHSINVAAMAGHNIVPHRRSKTRIFIGGGVFVSRNLSYSCDLPNDVYSDKFKFYKMNEHGVAAMRFGYNLNATWKYRYKGRKHKNGEYITLGLDLKWYNEGLFKSSRTGKSIFAPGLQFGVQF